MGENMGEKLILSREDVAEVTGLSTRSIDYLLRKGELTAKKIGRRTMILRSSVEKFCQSPKSVGITTDCHRRVLSAPGKFSSEKAKRLR